MMTVELAHAVVLDHEAAEAFFIMLFRELMDPVCVQGQQGCGCNQEDYSLNGHGTHPEQWGWGGNRK